MKRLICIAYFLAAIGISGSASAGGIAYWVDAEGVTHYGNPQFAPAGESNLIEVQAANIMDVPIAPPAQKPLVAVPRDVTLDRLQMIQEEMICH